MASVPGQRRFGPYAILRELGRGGMGAVYLGQDTRVGREVAIKTILLEHDGGDERFLREAHAVAKLQHPGIVRVHELTQHGGRLVLVMEFVDGESLDARLKREGPLDPEQAARVARDLADALAHAHDQGILHRDLKPANVLQGKDGRIVLTDFGLSKDLSASLERLTKTGDALGTPAYMPPEQVDGDLERIGEASDVYGLGATLFALVTGRAPFEGATAANLAVAVLTKPPPAPSSLAAEVPSELDGLVLKCLAKEPARRYPSAAALRDDLDRFLRGEPVLGRRPRRSRAPLAAAAALGLLVTAGLAWAVFAPVPPPPASEEKTTPVASGTEGQDEPPPLTAGEVQRGSSELRALERREGGKPAPFAEKVRAWLEQYPGHPEEAEARSLLAEALLRVPAVVVRHQGVVWAGLAGDRLLTVGPQQARLWTPGGEELRSWSLDLRPVDCALTRSGEALVVTQGPRATALLRFDLEASAPTVHSLPRTRRFTSLALGPKDELFALATEGEVQLYELPPPTPNQGVDSTEALTSVATFGPIQGSVRAMAFAPDAKRLAVCVGTSLLRDGARRREDALRIYDLSNETQVGSISFVGAPSSVDVSPDGRLAVVGTGGGEVNLIDLRNARQVARLRGGAGVTGAGVPSFRMAHSGPVRGVFFDPSGERLVSVSGASDFQRSPSQHSLWDVGSRERLRSQDLPLSPKKVTRPASRDCFVITVEDAVQVWRVP